MQRRESRPRPRGAIALDLATLAPPSSSLCVVPDHPWRGVDEATPAALISDIPARAGPLRPNTASGAGVAAPATPEWAAGADTVAAATLAQA